MYIAQRKTEHLPFFIQPITSQAQAQELCESPATAEVFTQADKPVDVMRGGILLLARAKLDRTLLGLVSLYSNSSAALPIEATTALPAELRNLRLMEISRVDLKQGTPGPVVEAALLKACFAYCAQQRIDQLLVCETAAGAHSYRRLLFKDVPTVALPGGPLTQTKVLSFDVRSGPRRMAEAKHPMLRFFFNTDHPDIPLFS